MIDLREMARHLALSLAQELAWLIEDNSTPEPNTGCRLWTAAVDANGYGRFSWRSTRFLAHRAAFQLAAGEIPGRLHLHHVCGQPSCVNPDHLAPLTADQHERVHVGAGELATGAGDISLNHQLREFQKAFANRGPYPATVLAMGAVR